MHLGFTFQNRVIPEMHGLWAGGQCQGEKVQLGKVYASSSAPFMKSCMLLRVVVEVCVRWCLALLTCAVTAVCVSGTQ